MTAPALARQPRGLSAVAWMPWAIGLVTAVDYFDNTLFAVFASYIFLLYTSDASRGEGSGGRRGRRII